MDVQTRSSSKFPLVWLDDHDLIGHVDLSGYTSEHHLAPFGVGFVIGTSSPFGEDGWVRRTAVRL